MAKPISPAGAPDASKLTGKSPASVEPTTHHKWRFFLARNLAFWLMLLTLVAFVVEGGAWITVQLLLGSRINYVLWDPDLNMVRSVWNANATLVDEELGWPSPSAAVQRPRDESGAKYNPDFAKFQKTCGSAYGDSFIWGDEVPLSDGWIEQLSRLLGCRVYNYGVSNYGTDQAYVRFRRMIHDDSPVVLLGIFADDIMRNVNQYRAFIGSPPEPFWVKGRFVLDGQGQLEWIGRPSLDADRWLDLHRNPARILPKEYLLPDTRDGPVAIRFPYVLTLAHIAMSPRIWSRLNGRTPWSDLYDVRHPSGAVPLTIAIVEAFRDEAERRGKKVMVVMLPGAGSVRTIVRSGKTDYAPFVGAMAAKGLNVFDPIPALIVALNGRSYCELYVRPRNCDGHFGVAGGALLAQVVAAELRRRNLIN